MMGFASLYPSYDLRRDPMHCANLVAVEITQVSEVQFAPGAFANARRVFASRGAIGDACRVPGVGLLGRFGCKTDGAAVGVCGRLAVDRLRHREHAGLGAVENAVAVDPGRLDAERSEQRVVKRLGLFQVVGTDHDMRKHYCNSSPFVEQTAALASSLPQGTNPVRCPLPANVTGAPGVVQAGVGQPRYPEPPDYGSVIRTGRPALSRQTRRLDAPP